MLIQQLIEKLKRERTVPEGCYPCTRRGFECDWCEGHNARTDSLIAELEQMLAEARAKEQSFQLEVEVDERTYERVAAYADEHGITAAEALERMVGRG